MVSMFSYPIYGLYVLLHYTWSLWCLTLQMVSMVSYPYRYAGTIEILSDLLSQPRNDLMLDLTRLVSLSNIVYWKALGFRL